MQTKRGYPNDFKNMNGNTSHLSSILIRRYISASVLTVMILLMLSCNNNQSGKNRSICQDPIDNHTIAKPTEKHQAQTTKVADTSGIVQYISRTTEKYPLITLADIYKGAFQDYMGPAHIIPDSQSARTYIVKELETADTLVGDYYEPCSWMGNYYRVNLSVIKEGLVPLETFSEAFVKSAKPIDTLLIKEWKEVWHNALPAIKENTAQITGFKEDSARIENLLQKGEYVIHHSKIFTTTYHPHYRIIEKNIFEKEILPLLK